jgi:O-acetyl-ADP-ribose deacetylase (regulator of RNase III)
VRIETVVGDIADQPDVDAVVNAANTELWMGSGVAGALKRRGGDVVESEALAQGPIRLGDAVLTSAGGLPNRHVLHAAAMGYRPEDEAVPKRAGSRSSAEIIRAATLRCLALAEGAGDASVAFPALATGVGGFPLEECAAAMVGAAREHERAHPGGVVERVRFVVRSEEDREVFSRYAAARSPSSRQGSA